MTPQKSWDYIGQPDFINHKVRLDNTFMHNNVEQSNTLTAAFRSHLNSCKTDDYQNYDNHEVLSCCSLYIVSYNFNNKNTFFIRELNKTRLTSNT